MNEKFQLFFVSSFAFLLKIWKSFFTQPSLIKEHGWFIKIICQIHQNYLPNSSKLFAKFIKQYTLFMKKYGNPNIGTWGLLKPPWSFHIFFKNCKIRLIVQIIRLIEKTISMNRQCPNWKCSTTTTNTNKVFVVVIVVVMCGKMYRYY